MWKEGQERDDKLAPQDDCKGAKHPAIQLTVPQFVENVMQRVREMLRS